MPIVAAFYIAAAIIVLFTIILLNIDAIAATIATIMVFTGIVCLTYKCMPKKMNHGLKTVNSIFICLIVLFLFESLAEFSFIEPITTEEAEISKSIYIVSTGITWLLTWIMYKKNMFADEVGLVFSTIIVLIAWATITGAIDYLMEPNTSEFAVVYSFIVQIGITWLLTWIVYKCLPKKINSGVKIILPIIIFFTVILMELKHCTTKPYPNYPPWTGICVYWESYL